MDVPPTTSAADALETAVRYVAEHRDYCHVTELLEDETDYLVATELNEPQQQWPLGPAAMLISKATGELYDEAWGNVIERLDKMTPVRRSGNKDR